MVLEYTLGKMDVNFEVNGKIIICTEMVSTFGQMEEVMQDNTKMIKNMVWVYINGLMEESMKENGVKVNKMEEGDMFNKMEMLNTEYGKMVKESNG